MLKTIKTVLAACCLFPVISALADSVSEDYSGK